MANPDTAHRGDGPTRKPSNGRWRSLLASVALVFMCLALVFAIVAIWADAVVQDTDRYVETVAPLSANADIQDAVTLAIMDQLEGIDLSSAIRDVVPSASDEIVSSLVVAVHSYTETTVHQVVASDHFATLWTEANHAVHAEVAGLLAGNESTLASVIDDTVSIDLAPVLAAVVELLNANGIPYFNLALSNVTNTELVLFDASQLRSAQELTRLLHRIAWFLPLLAIAFFALSVALARRRRVALRRAGIAIAVTMAILLVSLSLARGWQADQLASSARPAALAFFDILLGRLRDSVGILLVLGTLLAVAATVLHRGTWRWLTDRVRLLAATTTDRLATVFFGISALAAVALGASSRGNAGWVVSTCATALAAGIAGFIVQRARLKRQSGTEGYREGEA